MRFLPGSRSPKILELGANGMKPAYIAKELECSKSTVYKALRRYKVRQPKPSKFMKISALTIEEGYWLKCEARRIGVPWMDLARAMLTDAINEAKNG
jgi:transposase